MKDKLTIETTTASTPEEIRTEGEKARGEADAAAAEVAKTQEQLRELAYRARLGDRDAERELLLVEDKLVEFTRRQARARAAAEQAERIAVALEQEIVEKKRRAHLLKAEAASRLRRKAAVAIDGLADKLAAAVVAHRTAAREQQAELAAAGESIDRVRAARWEDERIVDALRYRLSPELAPRALGQATRRQPLSAAEGLKPRDEDVKKKEQTR